MPVDDHKHTDHGCKQGKRGQDGTAEGLHPETVHASSNGDKGERLSTALLAVQAGIDRTLVASPQLKLIEFDDVLAGSSCKSL
jgi:hypothetical protein